MNIKNILFALTFFAIGPMETRAQQSQAEADWVAERKAQKYKTYWFSIQWLPGEWVELQNDLKTTIVEKWETVNDSTITGRRFEMLDGKETRQMDQYLLEKRRFRLFLTLNPKSERPVKFRLKEKKEMIFVFENMEKGGLPGVVEISREARDVIRVAQKNSADAENYEAHTFKKQ